MSEHSVDIEIGVKPIRLETGRIAKQAGGAIVVRSGDTYVLVTATRSAEARDDLPFFPLVCDYREFTYSAGRFPGGYIKREGRPSEKEVLTSRMIDRPIRPLFPSGYQNETQLIANVHSADPEVDPSTLAMVGAFAALAISDIPLVHTIGAVRVSYIEDDDQQWYVNPTYGQREDASLSIIVAAAEAGIVMVEAEGQQVEEAIVLEAIKRGHEACKTIIEGIKQLVALCGKTKLEVPAPVVDEALTKLVAEKFGARLEEAFDTSKQDKLASYETIRLLKKECKAEFESEDDPKRGAAAGKILSGMQEKIFFKWILDENRRPDRRALDEIRALDCSVTELPRAHGSAVFQRGETQALVSTTLGTKDDTQGQERIEDAGYSKTFMVHYNFPPYSVGETAPLRGVGRREIGHGMLAERALTAVMPSQEDFPYTIRVVSEITESNGSSSMATVCGGALSLMDAGVPLLAPVAGIAMGLVTDGERFRVLTDIAGAEDHYGDMDFKVAGSAAGITALQMDIKQPNISLEVLEKALEQAKKARLEILDAMAKAIEAPRESLSKYAPQIHTLQIPVRKIRDVIGPGGKMIKSIVEETGAKIDVGDDGTVQIASSDGAALQAAIDRIKDITAEAEVGKTYLGNVTRIVEFGAFVEIFSGTEGLLHISEIAEHRIRDVRDELKVGDQILVKCLALEGNKIRLSRKAVLREQREKVRAQKPEGDELDEETDEQAADSVAEEQPRAKEEPRPRDEFEEDFDDEDEDDEDDLDDDEDFDDDEDEEEEDDNRGNRAEPAPRSDDRDRGSSRGGERGRGDRGGDRGPSRGGDRGRDDRGDRGPSRGGDRRGPRGGSGGGRGGDDRRPRGGRGPRDDRDRGPSRGGDRPRDDRGGDRGPSRGGDRPRDDRGGERGMSRGGDRPRDDRPRDDRGGDRGPSRGGDRPRDDRGGDDRYGRSGGGSGGGGGERRRRRPPSGSGRRDDD